MYKVMIMMMMVMVMMMMMMMMIILLKDLTRVERHNGEDEQGEGIELTCVMKRMKEIVIVMMVTMMLIG